MSAYSPFLLGVHSGRLAVLLAWTTCLLAIIGSTAFAQTSGRRLQLSSTEVHVSVGNAESEITATLQYQSRPSATKRNSYNLFIPVHVPARTAGSTAALKKFKPALSVERRPVILKRAEPPAALARIDTLPGMTIVWWKAILRWPRRGEALIVDMRYLQPNAVVDGTQSFIFVPIIPDGELSKESRITLHTDLPGIALHLRSGKLKKKIPFAKWIMKGRAVGKSLECNLENKLPVIVDLVVGK